MVALESEQVRLALDGESAVVFRTSGQSAPMTKISPRPASFFGFFKAGFRMLGRRLISIVPLSGRREAIQSVSYALAATRNIIRRGHQPTPATPSQKQSLAAPSVVAHPNERDVLWTCGDYISYVPLRWIAEEKRRKHFRVAAVGYDLIGVHDPEWTPAGLCRDHFPARIVDLLDSSDLLYCISERTQSDMIDFAATTYRSVPTLQLLKLGSGFPPENADLVSNTHIRQILQGRYALAVGRVEARKNYRLLIEAWTQLTKQPEFLVDLVIVGSCGEQSAALEIEASPLFGKRVFWLTSCPDSVLALLYQRCDMVLCPSLMGGWAMSVAEGVALGKPVVCSDRGGIPETAAMGTAVLIDPTDSEGWVDAIREIALIPSKGVDHLAGVPDWDQTADIVSRGLLSLAQAAVGR
jgi:glycosyltransferase involved in cell wall biosynthesis